MSVILVTCSCGARIEGFLWAAERDAFLNAHAICRTTPTVELTARPRRWARLRAI